MHQRRIDTGKGGRLVLQFGDDALGDFRADAGRARHCGLVTQRDRIRKVGRRQGAEHSERHLGADALHRLQEPKPFAFDIAAKAEQLDLVLAHVSLDREHRGLARRRQRLQRAARAMHLIADAADVEDNKILTVGVDQAFEFADHTSTTLSRSVVLWR
ncbi:hypothetical protein GALL_482930 [mine drainage metagenome]|uniref:Uncharacterized protein n=1 Tax=mine drainage metagenome TaxID=410659 RepID=A0A1J5Q2K4_9ZZZZ